MATSSKAFLSSNAVYNLAAEIGKVFEKLIDLGGTEEPGEPVKELMRKVIFALEYLESGALVNEKLQVELGAFHHGYEVRMARDLLREDQASQTDSNCQTVRPPLDVPVAPVLAPERSDVGVSTDSDLTVGLDTLSCGDLLGDCSSPGVVPPVTPARPAHSFSWNVQEFDPSHATSHLCYALSPSHRVITDHAPVLAPKPSGFTATRRRDSGFGSPSRDDYSDGASVSSLAPALDPSPSPHDVLSACLDPGTTPGSHPCIGNAVPSTSDSFSGDAPPRVHPPVPRSSPGDADGPVLEPRTLRPPQPPLWCGPASSPALDPWPPPWCGHLPTGCPPADPTLAPWLSPWCGWPSSVGYPPAPAWSPWQPPRWCLPFFGHYTFVPAASPWVPPWCGHS